MGLFAYSYCSALWDKASINSSSSFKYVSKFGTPYLYDDSGYTGQAPIIFNFLNSEF